MKLDSLKASLKRAFVMGVLGPFWLIFGQKPVYKG
jgi:hypothetical protein